jgi:VWFA-related protein
VNRLPALFLATAIGLAAAPRMVNFTAIAIDSHGQPVPDLTKADFSVQDSGKDQPIAWFHPNAPKSNGQISHATLVIFDLLDTDMTERGFAADEIVKALQGRESSQLLYLYLLSPDSKLLAVHPLPDSVSDLLPRATPWTRDIRTLLDNAMKSANRLRLSGITEDQRIKMVYETLQSAVNTMAIIRGQKSIVWISHGMPIELRVAGGGDQIDFRPLARTLGDAARLANVAMHAVDPSSSAVPSASQLGSVETLQLISNLGGGKVFTGNSIGKAIAQATQDWRASYTIGYIPPAENWDGKLHKLKLSTSRKGIELIYPTLYYADSQDRNAERVRAALQTAVSSPFESNEMGLRASSEHGKFEIHVNYRDAMVIAEEDHFVAELVVTFVDYSPKGPPIGVGAIGGIKIKMTAAQNEAAKKEGIAISQDHPPVSGTDKVRVIVYDPLANLLGSVKIPAQ